MQCPKVDIGLFKKKGVGRPRYVKSRNGCNQRGLCRMKCNQRSIRLVSILLLLWTCSALAKQKPCPIPSKPVSDALREAEKSARQISDSYLRSELLEQVAQDYVRNGVFPPAIAIIHTDSALMWQASDDLAGSMLDCHQIAELQALAPTLNGRSHSLVLRWVAEWEASHNEREDSQKTVASISDQDIREDAEFTIIIARSLKSKSGDTETQLRKLLNSLPHPMESTDNLIFQDLALISAMKGNLNESLAQLKRMSGAAKVFSAYTVIQSVAPKYRKSDTASFGKQVVAMVQPFLNVQSQAYPLCLLAGALANIGSFEAGVQLANSIPNPQRKEEGLVIIAVHLIEAAKTDRAMQIMRNLPPVLPGKPMLAVARQLAWARIAMAESNSGDGVAALQTLQSITDPRLKSLLIVQRSYALATAGRFTEAESIAGQAGESFPNNTRGRAIRLVAAVYAHSRGQAEAMKWAASLKDPSDRVSAYLGIADGLLGKPREEIPPYFED